MTTPTINLLAKWVAEDRPYRVERIATDDPNQCYWDVNGISYIYHAYAQAVADRLNAAHTEAEIIRLFGPLVEALDEAYAELSADSTRDGPRCLLLTKMEQALAGDTK